MNERVGWLLVAIGVFLCLLAWCGFAAATYLYATSIGERMFQ